MTKFLFSALVIAFAVPAHAFSVKSVDVPVSIARVTQVTKLVEKPNLQVSVATHDLGGSTDVSATMTVFLTLYSKGEIFSTDATFKIADVLSFESAKRVSGGMYEVVATTYDGGSNGLQRTTYLINAIKAVNAIQTVNCGGDFGCDASSQFESEVDVQETSVKL